ncbi:RING/U-box superfamily protein [Striga asiatica]|uniref:RING/U-box superfamily protein n=1 Tax=Striga asiatica TaxID=4170 RepID=A0A5A7REH2_STRAF|nr:RING/U-box superfamily protein [Striga asiatica]
MTTIPLHHLFYNKANHTPLRRRPAGETPPPSESTRFETTRTGEASRPGQPDFPWRSPPCRPPYSRSRSRADPSTCAPNRTRRRTCTENPSARPSSCSPNRSNGSPPSVSSDSPSGEPAELDPGLEAGGFGSDASGGDRAAGGWVAWIGGGGAQMDMFSGTLSSVSSFSMFWAAMASAAFDPPPPAVSATASSPCKKISDASEGLQRYLDLVNSLVFPYDVNM